MPVTSTEIQAYPTPERSPEPDTPARDAALRHRLLGYRPTDRFWGWAVPLLIAAVGGFLRFWHLDQPHQLVFDETYYVKQAASFLKAGYELSTNSDSTPKPDELFAQGKVDIFLSQADFVVHPPAGKWMIAFGEWVFGPASAWGWRFSAAAVGTLSILMIGRIARRLFGSTLLGGLAALLLAMDGEHFVLSRTGLLDVFVMFWALAGFGFLLLDRDRTRARLADKISARTLQASGAQTPDTQPALTPPNPASVTGAFGPWLGPRWWRIAGIVSLGLCAATKWSGVFFLVAFLTASVFWDLSARRAADIPHWFVGSVLKDWGQALVTTLVLAPATYLISWSGWFLSSNAYNRRWAVEHPSSHWSWVPDSLRSLWHYHQDMYHFNITLHSPHVYQANPWSWIVLGRPTAFYYESYKEGSNGCHVTECSRAITDLGNPLVWWGGTIAIGVLLFTWLLGRDWRAGAILAGLAGGYLPWFFFQARTIYTFYAIAFVPWIVLALTFSLGRLLGPRSASPTRRMYGAIAAGSIVIFAVLAFAFFWPILSAQVIPRSEWSARMWLPSWI